MAIPSVTHVCRQCGGAFDPWSNTRGWFCSRACSSVFRRRPLAERFWPKVDRRAPGECWLWTGSRSPQGYGQISQAGERPELAHRVAWALAFGPPGGLSVCHHCDVRTCCNPAHLFLGTARDNALDMVAKGRWRNGAASGPAHRRGD